VFLLTQSYHGFGVAHTFFSLLAGQAFDGCSNGVGSEGVTGATQSAVARSMRGEMVIASIAELQISLNKMVLVESRARLPDESQCDSTNDSVAVMIELDGRPMLMDLPRSICLGHHDHLGIL
jgi:hypothetical protein